MTVIEILTAIEQLDEAEQQELWDRLRAVLLKPADVQSPARETSPGIYEVAFDDLPLPEDWPPADYALNIDHYLYGMPKSDA